MNIRLVLFIGWNGRIYVKRGVRLKKSVHIATTFVGLIVGAGFASGQEMMQYFTSFGWTSFYAIIVATIIFAFLGMQIAKLGSDLGAYSHKELIYKIAGYHAGFVIDVFITLALFGVTIVMFAGAGAMFEQMLGIDALFGQLFLAVVTMFTLMLNVQIILRIIALLIPYFVVLVVIIAVYTFFTSDLSILEQHQLAIQQPSATSHWLISAIVYVSYNIATGVSMLAVLGGTEKNRTIAGFGGLLGGILLGVLILLVNFSLLMKIDVAVGKPIPMLALANFVHPVVGILMSILLFGKMYNTAVGTLYAFTVRLVSPEKRYFKLMVVLFSAIGFVTSSVGFTTLVGKLYSVMGYIGLLLIFCVVRYSLSKKPNKDTQLEEIT